METIRSTYDSTGTLGGRGEGRGRFRSSLRGVAVAQDGRVAAVGDRAVTVWSADGELLAHWPTSRPGLAVAVAPDGRVLVGESGRIEVFDAEGRLLETWRDDTRLALVTSIHVHGEHIFAADARARVIRRLSLDGALQLSIGAPGRRGFALPTGFLDFGVDAGGTIHAANPGKHRVERFSKDGEMLGRFGRFGMFDPKDFTGCCNPIHVAVAGGDVVAVTEKAPPRAKVYDLRGKLLSVIDGSAFDPGCRRLDIAMAPSGRLIVADSERLEIRIFDPTPPASPRPRAERREPADVGATGDG